MAACRGFFCRADAMYITRVKSALQVSKKYSDLEVNLVDSLFGMPKNIVNIVDFEYFVVGLHSQ